MMKKVNILIYLAMMVFLPACEEEDTGIIYGKPSGLIHQVWFDSELAYEYTYNEADLVIEEKADSTTPCTIIETAGWFPPIFISTPGCTAATATFWMQR